jgi:hypothetical protein
MISPASARSSSFSTRRCSSCAAQTRQRVLHFVREAAQGRRQRRAGGQCLGQGMDFQQHAVAARLHRDIHRDRRATRRHQRDTAQLHGPLFGQRPRRRDRRVRAGQQPFQRHANGAARPQLQPVGQGGVDPFHAQAGVDRGHPRRQLLGPSARCLVDHCTMMGNVRIWCNRCRTRRQRRLGHMHVGTGPPANDNGRCSARCRCS